MSRLTHALIALSLIAAPISADTSKALDLVPQDALAFILVKDLRQLSDKVDNLAKKLDVKEYRSLLDLIKTEMEIREGLDDKGSALILVMKGKKEQLLRQPIFALPVADRAKILAQLGVKDAKERISKGSIGAQSGLLFSIGGSAPDDKVSKKAPILVAIKGDFVLLASLGDRDALEQILDSKQSITASVQQASKWLDEQDNEEADAKVSTKRMGFGFLAKVDDSPAFVQEYVQLLQQLQQAMQKYSDSKFEVKTEQKRIADKPCWLITIRTPNGERKGGSKEKIDYSEQTLLLTEIDSRTVMGADLSNGATRRHS